MKSQQLTKPQQTTPLEIVPVSGRRLMCEFIRVPWSLYSLDPCWVPPLISEQERHLSTKNPYFEHADFQAWIAYRGKMAVGRISAQIDHLHLRQHQDSTGFFGLLESEDEEDTFRSLFNVAEEWLRQKGMVRIRGPFSLSINDECGLLIEGFDSPPPIMLGHALPYYAQRVEEQGYTKIQDLLAYRILKTQYPKSKRYIDNLIRKYAGKIKVRTMRRDHFNEDLAIIRDIFEDAWSNNWGFIPFTSAEFSELGKNLRFLVDFDAVQIAEIDGEPVAMMVMFPNVNEIIKDLNGRLLPFGWVKFLWRLKVSGVKSARIPLMGVRRRYQGSSLGAALALMTISQMHAKVIKEGILDVDMSWILEENQGVRNIIESVGSTVYKRYRIYQKGLSGDEV